MENQIKCNKVMEKHEKKYDALIPALLAAQKENNCITKKTLNHIAKTLNIPSAVVNGVASFHSMLHLGKPGECGKNIVSVCESISCHLKGKKNILIKLQGILGINAGQITKDNKFTLETVSCLGACDKAPVMMINEDLYTNVKEEEIEDILGKYM